MTAFLWIFYGAAGGAALAVALYVLGFAVEILNCTCHILTCNCNGDYAIPTMWNWNTFGHVLLFCVIGGTAIGIIISLVKFKIAADERKARVEAANSEEARKQREKWAREIFSKAQSVSISCEKNRAYCKPVVSTTYSSENEMNRIMKELSKVAELQGQINALADELTKNGGDNA